MRKFLSVMLVAVLVSYCGVAPVGELQSEDRGITKVSGEKDEGESGGNHTKLIAIIAGATLLACYGIPKLQAKGNNCRKILKEAGTATGDKLKQLGQSITDASKKASEKVKGIFKKTDDTAKKGADDATAKGSESAAS